MTVKGHTGNKDYSYQNDFEMVYLRHDFIAKTKRLNPEYIKEFKYIVKITATRMYDKLQVNFVRMGMELEDLISISNIYLMTYMDLYSFRENPIYFDKYIAQFKKKYGPDAMPTEEEIRHKERNLIINYLRQRIQYCYLLCERKLRNISVGSHLRLALAETDKSVAADATILSKNYHKLGYRKVQQRELKELRKNSKGEKLTDKNGFRVIEIELLTDGITAQEYEDFTNWGENRYTSDAESMIIEVEKDMELAFFKQRFGELTTEEKVNLLQEFLRKNNCSKLYKKELSLARKMLLTLKNVL